MIFTSIPKAEKHKISHYNFADLFYSDFTKQKALHSSQTFSKGDIITTFKAAEIQRTANRFTVQVADEKHIILSPEFLQYINHSCLPNVFFDTENMKLICLSDVSPGDEFVMFYPATEWDMAEPFNCMCGNLNCLGVIRGAKYLPYSAIQHHKVNGYIKTKHQQQSTSTHD